MLDKIPENGNNRVFDLPRVSPAVLFDGNGLEGDRARRLFGLCFMHKN